LGLIDHAGVAQSDDGGNTPHVLGCAGHGADRCRRVAVRSRCVSWANRRPGQSRAEQVVIDLDKFVVKSQLVGEENPMDGDLEGFGHAHLHVDLNYLPSSSVSLNKGALLGDRLVAVHVKIDLFGRWIAVVPIHYLLAGSHPCTRRSRFNRRFDALQNNANGTDRAF
jgi:hypothetical protein